MKTKVGYTAFEDYFTWDQLSEDQAFTTVLGYERSVVDLGQPRRLSRVETSPRALTTLTHEYSHALLPLTLWLSNVPLPTTIAAAFTDIPPVLVFPAGVGAPILAETEYDWYVPMKPRGVRQVTMEIRRAVRGVPNPYLDPDE